LIKKEGESKDDNKQENVVLAVVCLHFKKKFDFLFIINIFFIFRLLLYIDIKNNF